MGVFGKMSEETPTGASRYFNEGEYICRVRRCQLFQSQQGKGNGVALEVTILEVLVHYEADRPCWIEAGKLLPASNNVGDVASTILWLDRQAPAMGNLKNFLLSTSGLSESQIIRSYADRNDLDVVHPDTAVKAWEEFCEQCTGGTGETLAGTIVNARAQMIKTKQQKPFTRVVWEAPQPDVVAKYSAPAANADQPAAGAAGA